MQKFSKIIAGMCLITNSVKIERGGRPLKKRLQTYPGIVNSWTELTGSQLGKNKQSRTELICTIISVEIGKHILTNCRTELFSELTGSGVDILQLPYCRVYSLEMMFYVNQRRGVR